MTNDPSWTGHANRDCAAVDLGIDAKWIDDLDSRRWTFHVSDCFSAFWLTLESFLDAGRATESAWARLEEAKAREARLQEHAARMERAPTAPKPATTAAAGHGALTSIKFCSRLTRPTTTR